MSGESLSGVRRSGESVAPLGLGVDGGMEPSAHALGYRLTALRAWGHGSLRREAAWVFRDRTRFFSVSVRYRYRFRSRYRRVRRGVAGWVRRPPGACRVGMLGMATTDTLAALRLCGLSASSSGAMKRRLDLGVRGGRGSVAPPGAGCSWGTEPSAHALGYRLAVLRAWDHGFGGREAAGVPRACTRFFSLGFRYRSRSRLRSRYRAGRLPHHLPDPTWTDEEPGRLLLPHASVSGSVSASASQVKTSMGA